MSPSLHIHPGGGRTADKAGKDSGIGPRTLRVRGPMPPFHIDHRT